MAGFTPNQLLKETSTTVLKDWKHAARLFVDNQFQFAPKHKFLFHTYFSINKAALSTITLSQNYNNTIGMLVKSADLPNYEIKIDTLNQYNRKKNVQYIQSYKPINLVFHDDNMGLINQLWQNYYSYYFADPNSAAVAGAFARNATQAYASAKPTPYGLDNGSTNPFFNYIKIYQMARHEFVCYKIINPIITAFNHNKMEYGQNSTADNTMTIAYEAVEYSSGDMNLEYPEGFADTNYDQTPSPLIGENPGTSTWANVQGVKDNAYNFVQNINDTIGSYNQNNLPISNQPVNGVKPSGDTSAPVNGTQGVKFPQSTNTNTPNEAKNTRLT